MIYKMSEDIRIEKDSIGEVNLPKNAYYGAQTQRAVLNFPISGLKSHTELIDSIILIKKAASTVNKALGLLSADKAREIINACHKILSGNFYDQFVVDIYQAGAGTSLNMNTNEVIANLASKNLGHPLGTYKIIHPNDDVNMSQSTNDVIPTAIRIAILKTLPALVKSLRLLSAVFGKKSRDFSNIIKTGRTHLQDALPITLGQEFGAYYQTILNDMNRIIKSMNNLTKIGIGGTAVGTGINSHPRYHTLMVEELSDLTKLPLKSNQNLFESMQSTADFLDLSSSLRILAQTLIRIGSDLRFLSSGPKAGLAEINLPSVQPGSSIMPGKVNPSIVEMLIMVCFQVIGFDQAILLSSMSGQLELNVMLPLIAYNLIEQIKILTNSVSVFREKCVDGISANKEMCNYWLKKSSGTAAVLNPYLGYDKTAQLVKLSLQTNKPLKGLVVQKGYFTSKQADKIFSVSGLTKPNLKSKIK